MYEGPIQDLIDELSRLPGIGPRGASRIAFFLLDAPEEDVFGLADTLRRVKESSRVCRSAGPRPSMGEMEPPSTW